MLDPLNHQCITWKNTVYLALETYSLVVHSSINAISMAVVVGSGLYFAQKYLLRMDMSAAKPFEIGKMIACNTFIENLFSPLEDIVLMKKKLTYEELKKEVMYIQEPNWRKEALEILLFAATFFPKSYLSFRLAAGIGCLGETIQANKDSLRLTFYAFTVLKLFNYSIIHFTRLRDAYNYPKCKLKQVERLGSVT